MSAKYKITRREMKMPQCAAKMTTEIVTVRIALHLSTSISSRK